jgi:hypothetical protein
MAENMTNELATIDFLFDPNSNIGPNSTLNGCSKVWRSTSGVDGMGWTIGMRNTEFFAHAEGPG